MERERERRVERRERERERETRRVAKGSNLVTASVANTSESNDTQNTK